MAMEDVVCGLKRPRSSRPSSFVLDKESAMSAIPNLKYSRSCVSPFTLSAQCAAAVMSGMSTFYVAIPSTSPKKLYGELFNARCLTASSVFSILRVVNHRVVYRPVGSTFAIQSSIPPISTGIVPLAPSTCRIKSIIDENNSSILFIIYGRIIWTQHTSNHFDFKPQNKYFCA
ncbi:hypothetical protein F5146DRAFT_530784 [Armillaria mellea]|nr:hypothetical protein F5146DRAFT_530784 [Armillaria mellea]